jgi:hypothetical protein
MPLFLPEPQLTPDLNAAARDLAHDDVFRREQAESLILGAGEEGTAALIAILQEKGPAFARAALLLGALRARSAIAALSEAALSGALRGEQVAYAARALAEIVDGQDAFNDLVRSALDALSRHDDNNARALPPAHWVESGMWKVKGDCGPCAIATPMPMSDTRRPRSGRSGSGSVLRWWLLPIRILRTWWRKPMSRGATWPQRSLPWGTSNGACGKRPSTSWWPQAGKRSIPLSKK